MKDFFSEAPIICPSCEKQFSVDPKSLMDIDSQFECPHCNHTFTKNEKNIKDLQNLRQLVETQIKQIKSGKIKSSPKILKDLNQFLKKTGKFKKP